MDNESYSLVCKENVEYVGRMKRYGLNVKNGNNVIDLSGYTLLSGLFNTRVHLDLNFPCLGLYLLDLFIMHLGHCYNVMFNKVYEFKEPPSEIT